MRLRTQILLSVLGITVLAQLVFGFVAYRQITESRGDQLTIFLQYLNREIAERLTLPTNDYVAEIYLEELRKKFSTPKSVLIIQKDNRILHIAGKPQEDITAITDELRQAYTDKSKHGMIHLNDHAYYWAVSQLPAKGYQLVMLEPAADEEKKIASTLRFRLLSAGLIILWIAVWISLLLTTKISRQLNEKNEQLKHMALHDRLTGLSNRTLLSDRLEQLLRQSQRNEQHFALLLIDLDRFKEINDTLGHQFGDKLLKQVSQRLLKSIREEDSVARLGGDEFAILLPQTGRAGAELIARRIIHTMEEPFIIDDVSTESRASIGIALYPEHGNNSDSLMQYADVAMYQAKRSQTGYAIYDPQLNTHSVRRLRLMNDLREAIEQNRISIYYQPVLRASNRQVYCVEALARWLHPELGEITPDEFIPMAEQMGIIRRLSMQVLKQAISDSVRWKKQGYQLSISINISTFCLQDISLVEKIKNILQHYNFDASMLQLEITESALMNDLSRAGKMLDQLRRTGLQLAIDDFGTGFSSLSYLKKLPVDAVKIDKSFILDMCSNNSDNAIVKSIIELGHNLQYRVIAEGIEDERTLEQLLQMRIDAMQGFYFSKALPADELLEWLLNNHEQNDFNLQAKLL
ncbi:MAG TPA: EAL domain-containing protein [Gammaproteobacteria bacterium]|nr:EAL domain-containing protein [Gammaproteobacteria bacterium]